MGILKTGVDRIVDLVCEKKVISLADASHQLGMPLETLQEIADFLDEEHIIDIKYKFTVPYLYARAIAPEELQLKKEEVKTQKHEVMRRIEATEKMIDHHSNAYNGVREGFLKVASKLTHIKGMKEDIARLEECRRKKHDAEKRLIAGRHEIEQNAKKIGKQIAHSKERYGSLLKGRLIELKKPSLHRGVLARNEEQIKERIANFKNALKSVEAEMKKDNSTIDTAKINIKDLRKMHEQMERELARQNKRIRPLAKTQEHYEKKINDLSTGILSKLLKQRNTSLKTRIDSADALRYLFRRQKDIGLLLAQSESEKLVIANSINQIKKRNLAVDALTKEKTAGDIAILEKRLAAIEKKKKAFEKKIKTIVLLFKSKEN